MKEYWPMAKIKEKDGTVRNQYTYDSCRTIREALDAIAVWGDFYHFNIVEAWIDLKNGKYSERIKVERVWVAFTVCGLSKDKEIECKRKEETE